LQSVHIVFDRRKLKAKFNSNIKNEKYKILLLEVFGVNALSQIREMRAQIISPPKQRPSVDKYREAFFKHFKRLRQKKIFL